MSSPILAGDVQPESVDWLWPTTPDVSGRIPRGMLSVVAGRPDQGKGLFGVRVAADVSSAGGNVLYCASEDSHSLMTRPRLEAAGAKLSNIALWRFSLPAQFMEMAETVIDRDIDLIVLDPLASVLGSGISRHSDNIRQVLNPLTDLIESTGTAVVIIEHALKRVSPNSHPLAAIGGTGSGISAAARMAFLFGVDPQNEDRRVLAAVKSNIRARPPAIAFEVDATEIEGVKDEVPFLIYECEETFDPIRLVAHEESHGKVGRPDNKIVAAAEWLTNEMVKRGEPVLGSDLVQCALHAGISSRTLRRAADEMKVVRNPPNGGKTCKWSLPDEILELLRDGSDEDIEQAGEEIARQLPEVDEELVDGLSQEDIDKLLGGE